ncbi:MAG: formylmethanofuran dehydrogenase subunit A [Archaeoglobaceae archaeon]
MALHIKNGFVIDPKNGINGKMDLFVKDGVIVDQSEVKDNECEVIDASNKLVVAGGIDIHAHIATRKVNAGRAMRPEEFRTVRGKSNNRFRSTVGRTLLTSPGIGYEYAKMGYTTAVEPATPPLYTLHTHEELNSIPIIDKVCLPLFGNWHLVFKFAAEKDIEKLASFISWAMDRMKGYGVKLVNPGGVEAWMYGSNVHHIDDQVPGFDVTVREVITSLMKANDELKMPHSIHIHCNNLGNPGNYETTLETLKLARGMKKDKRQNLHATHVQFNAFSGSEWKDISSGAEEIAKYVNNSDNVTMDMGQVIFGHSTTMTADSPFQFEMHKLMRKKWVNSDVELETGGGIVPVVYKPGSPVHAVMWTIGLELGLLVDPDKNAVSTDYPNGGPFEKYPYIMTMLLSKKYREEEMKKAHKYIQRSTNLPSIETERTLEDIIKLTRTTPAKILGLEDKGHLGTGADADIAIYDINPQELNPNNYKEIEKALSSPACTIKGGEVVAKDGKLVKDIWGRTLWVDATHRTTTEIIEADLEEYFNYYTVMKSNYGVEEEWMRNPKRVEVR